MWKEFINIKLLQKLIRQELCRCSNSVTSLTTTEIGDLEDVNEGRMVYNSTTKKYNFYNGTDWEVVESV